MIERMVVAEIPEDVMNGFESLHESLNAKRRKPGEITTAEYLAQNFPPGTGIDAAYKELKRALRDGLVELPRKGIDDNGRACSFWKLADSGKLRD